jgi:hypothetical protein
LPFTSLGLKPGKCPQPRTGGRLLADSFREQGLARENPVDGRLIRITTYELKLENALRANLRELRALQKEDPFPAGEAERAEPAAAPATTSAPAPEPQPTPEPQPAPGPAAEAEADAAPVDATPVQDSNNAPKENELTAPASAPDMNAGDGSGP